MRGGSWSRAYPSVATTLDRRRGRGRVFGKTPVTAGPRVPLPAPGPFAHERCEWHEARAALDVAAAVTHAAAARRESRGAHQREDHPETDPAQAHNQVLRLEAGSLAARPAAPAPDTASAAS